DHLDPASTVIVIGIYTLISASTVAGPIIATLIAPDRMEPSLLRAEAFISKYGPIATAVIMLMIGVVIVGDGLTRL
ncbi:MAG TPA: GAP family protein, partial [Amnibacterium sp.]|uniref:GAP family protein n=1 Tax=Amnibacterium sp. TaxID=1872496 RepID=UPI002F94A168